MEIRFVSIAAFRTAQQVVVHDINNNLSVIPK